jgi:hypothetical protein
MSLSNVVSLAVILFVVLSVYADDSHVTQYPSFNLAKNKNFKSNYTLFDAEPVLYVHAELQLIKPVNPNVNATVAFAFNNTSMDSFNATATTKNTTSVIKAYGPCHFKNNTNIEWTASLSNPSDNEVVNTTVTFASTVAFGLPVDNSFSFPMNAYGAFLYLTVPATGLESFTIQLSSNEELPIASYEFSDANSCNSTTHTITAGTRSFVSAELFVKPNSTYYVTLVPSANFNPSATQNITVTTANVASTKGLSTGAIVGIVIGSIAGVVISFIVIYMVIRTNKQPESHALLRN